MMKKQNAGTTVEELIYTKMDGEVRIWSNVKVLEVHSQYSIVLTVDGVRHLKNNQIDSIKQKKEDQQMSKLSVGTQLSKVIYTKLNGEIRTWENVEILEVHNDWSLVKTNEGPKHLKHNGVNLVVVRPRTLGQIISKIVYLTLSEEVRTWENVEVLNKHDEYMCVLTDRGPRNLRYNRIISKTEVNYEMMMKTKCAGSSISHILYTDNSGTLHVWANVTVQEVNDNYSVVSTIDGMQVLNHNQVNFMID